MTASFEDTAEYKNILSRALGGDLDSQCALGHALEDAGQNDVALGWYQKAALKGHIPSSIGAGLLCLKADSTYQKDAFYWFQKAAAAGSAEGEYQLALLFERGIGVKMDPDEALRLLRIAASHGHKVAKEKLDGFSLFLDQIVPNTQQRRRGAGA